MNIHEYQAKEIFKEYGLPVAPFFVSTKATGIGKAAYELAPGPFVVKSILELEEKQVVQLQYRLQLKLKHSLLSGQVKDQLPVRVVHTASL